MTAAPAPSTGPKTDVSRPALGDLDAARRDLDDALTDVDSDLPRAAARLATLVDQYVRAVRAGGRLAAAGNTSRHARSMTRDRQRVAALRAGAWWDCLDDMERAIADARAEGLTWTAIGDKLGITRNAAYSRWRHLPPPCYPDPGSDIPPGENGGMPGYVVGLCRHRVAGSEWRAGLSNCERCGG